MARGANGIDEEWLARHDEEVLLPTLPIVDSHHHLWSRPPFGQYLLPDFVKDIHASGHAIRGSIFVECRSMYRHGGDADMRPIGEVEFANGMGAICGSTPEPMRLCAGIVGFVDMTGPRVREVLEQMKARAPERFRGIRHIASWDADEGIRQLSMLPPPPQGLLSDPRFLQGMEAITALDLVFEINVNYPQLPEAIALADRFPQTRLVLTHMGGLLGIGPYAGRAEERFATWSASIRELARRPNVAIKIGGIGMKKNGLGFHDREMPPSSEELAQVWRPHVSCCIDAFGTERAMFESNYPVDKTGIGLRVLWNTFKRLTQDHSPHERANLFALSAIHAYRLPSALAAP